MASTVWYIGKGSRLISTEAWEAYGITAGNTFWSAHNAWAIPTADLSQDQLNVLDTMRDQFRLNQEGPRVWPAPNQIKDYQESAYIYYARMVDLYEGLLELETGPVGPQGPTGPQGPPGTSAGRGNGWFTGIGAPGTVAGSIVGDKYLDVATGQIYTLS